MDLGVISDMFLESIETLKKMPPNNATKPKSESRCGENFQNYK
jgi:hypothetical protein